MSDIPFFRTPIGQRFYERTLPELVRTLAHAADALERIAMALERQGAGLKIHDAAAKDASP